jgi:TPR repeat protein
MEIRNPKTANYSKAIQLFNRSAETNNGDGYSGLGYMYMNGFGIESNITAALEMFEKGAELGSL